MNYGLYLSAAGVLTGMHRMDVLAADLANAETAGFKPDMVYVRQRLPERLESPAADTDPQWLLEQLGGGPHAHPTIVSSEQGPLEATDSPLDLALEGEGLFVVALRNGQTRFTRDGRLTIGPSGTLVMAATGLPVLDDGGRPITLAARGAIEVDRRGTIRQDGRAVATLRLVHVDAMHLVKAGTNLLALQGAGAAAPGDLPAAPGSVRQGFIEQSAVDPILTLSALVAATKAAQDSARLMQYHDHLMGQAIGTLGRVA